MWKKPSLEQRAVDLIFDNKFVCLAVVCPDGTPWVAPVFFTCDENLDFYYISDPKSRHGESLKIAAKCAWSIYLASRSPETTDGIQLAGSGWTITDRKEVDRVQRIIYRRRFPNREEWKSHIKDPDHFLNSASPQRLYALRPTEYWILDRDHPKGTQRLAVSETSLKMVWLKKKKPWLNDH